MKRMKRGGSSSKAPRRIEGLQSVGLAAESPWPKLKLKGSRAKGKTYERRVGKYLRAAFAGAPTDFFEGQWLSFYDANGRGYAQPDIYMVFPTFVLVVEVKLKQNTLAHKQLDGLYRPLLERLYQRPTLLLQVFKFPRWEADERRVADWTSVLSLPPGRIFEWHWLG